MAVDDLTGVGKVFETIVAAVEKAIGGIFAPYQIKRVGYAEAQVEAYKIEARAEAEERAAMISAEAQSPSPDRENSAALTIRQRAGQRVIAQEVSRQQNIENIVERARISAASAEATRDEDDRDPPEPRPIEADWMNSFIEYAQNVTADELQDLWAQLLVNQATEDRQLISRAALDSMRLLESRHAKMLERAVRLYAGMGQIMEVDPVEGVDTAYFPHMHEAIALEDLGILRNVRDVETALSTHFGVLTFWSDEIENRDGSICEWHADERHGSYPALIKRIGRLDPRDQRQHRKDLRIERQILTSRGFELAPTILPGFAEMFQPGVTDEPRLGDYGSVDVRRAILDHWASKFSRMGAAIVLNQSQRVFDRPTGVQNELVMTHLFDPAAQEWVDLQDH